VRHRVQARTTRKLAGDNLRKSRVVPGG
jgi:hypothetical protein